MSFGKVIRNLRMQQNLTQAELADAVGITQGFLSKLERGDAAPQPYVLEKLSSVLGVVSLDAPNPEYKDGDYTVESVFLKLEKHDEEQEYERMLMLTETCLTRPDYQSESLQLALSYWQARATVGLGRYEEALGKLLLVLPQSPHVRSKASHVMFYDLIGLCYMKLSEPKMALKYLLMGQDLFPSLNTSQIKTKVSLLWNLANVHIMLQDFDTAQRCLAERNSLLDAQLSFYRKRKADSLYLRASMTLLGGKKEDMIQALRNLGLSLAYYKLCGDVTSIISCLNNIGHAHQVLQNNEKRHMYYSRAVETAVANPGKVSKSTRANLASEGYVIPQ